MEQAQKTCRCPSVIIKANSGQVTEMMHRQVADLLNASVELLEDGSQVGAVKFGKHRKDCPCCPE